jgi:hypothetical protein
MAKNDRAPLHNLPQQDLEICAHPGGGPGTDYA